MTEFPVNLLVGISEEKSVSRYIELPFVPFPRLQILDDTFYSLEILDVTWDGEAGVFICPVDPILLTATSLQDALDAGWEEVEQDEEDCPECNGTGEAPNPFFSCQYCKNDDGESTGSYEDYRRKRDRLED